MSTLGYAFASANAVPEANRETREVAFTIIVDPGRRVYVRRVNIGGNTRTKDEVIRREMRQYEAGWFDADRVRLSKERARPARLLRDRDGRHARRADSAGSGGRQCHGQGARDRQHPARRRLLELGGPGADGRAVAATTCSAPATRWRSRSIPASRTRCSRSRTPIRTSPRGHQSHDSSFIYRDSDLAELGLGERRLQHAWRRIGLWHSVHRVRPGLPRAQVRRHDDRPHAGRRRPAISNTSSSSATPRMLWRSPADGRATAATA